MILLHKYGHLSQIKIGISYYIMLYERGMLNKNNLMMLFTAMHFSCSVSVDNIARDSAKQSFAFHLRTYFRCFNRPTPFLCSAFSTDVVILVVKINGYAGLFFSQIIKLP